MKLPVGVRLSVYLILIVAVFLINLPLLSMLGTAFKSRAEVMSNLGLLPGNPSVENFVYVLRNSDFSLKLFNSLVYSCIVTFLAVVFSVPGGYAISRFRGLEFAASGMLLFFFQLLPFMLFLIPLYLIFKALHISNTPFSVIIGYLCSVLPFSIWMLKGFFDTISVEMEESAMIDGCSHWKMLWRVVAPVALPGIATVAIFSFIRAWNEYLLIVVLIQREEYLTLTVGLQNFVQESAIDWGGMSAASTLSVLPSMLFLLFFQKYLIQGLSAGSVKG